jgi:hypothetical protein
VWTVIALVAKPAVKRRDDEALHCFGDGPVARSADLSFGASVFLDPGFETSGEFEPPDPSEEAARTFVFRHVHRNGSTVAARGMSEDAINNAVRRACVRALRPDGRAYSARSLEPASPPTPRSVSDRVIAHQARHRSLASLDQYIRIESAWADNAATALDL